MRVDLRGSGESDGVLQDEYLQQELDDGVEVLRWIGAQPWCTGAVGMMGISWGGFNGLQIAALQPPELEGVITLCSTDDRYADNVHHMGGCMLGDNLSWASTMFDQNACPPDPALVGERWRDQWLERLDGSGLWLEKWLRHQRRDDYWKHGSVAEDYSAIRCPVYAVSGWADGYCNAVFRLVAGLAGSGCKGLVGPWAHKYPPLGEPGPAIGFLQEALRWWDWCLKGIDTGIMDEPRLRVWMQDSVPPSARYDVRPGRWVAGWPLLRDGLDLFFACVNAAKWAGCPYKIENPVGRISGIYPPDESFDPCDYGGYLDPPGDAYTKKTCLWTGNGFIMPPKRRVEPVEGSKMHLLPPSEDRERIRSQTPKGFAQAVFEANVENVRKVVTT